MKTKYIQSFMGAAEHFADLSTARRLHVGAIIVKDDRIISIGYNGTPSGWDNNCEDYDYMSVDAGGWIDTPTIEKQWPYTDRFGRRYALKTKPEVLHAETNAIAKLARSTESGDGATLFVTHAPCLDCAKLVYQSGISTVYYRNDYKLDTGINFLRQAGVKIEKV
jgi:dCMP deaminase